MADRAQEGWLQRALTTVVSNWLDVGRNPTPKVRDPQNAALGGGTSSGAQVTDATAMRLSAFWACTRLIASTIGSLPFPAYWSGDNGVLRPATETPLYKVLHDSPNADQTPVDFWEFGVIALILRGDLFARKIVEGGRLIALEPVNPALVRVSRLADGGVRYQWTEGSDSFDLTDEDVFHVRGFGGGPLRGLSTVAYARESLGLAIAADRAAGSLFRNGVNPSGVLSTDAALDRVQQNEAEELLNEKFAGALQNGRPMVLGHGLKWQTVTMNADDAQLLQSRAWSVEEICRWFGVPPFMIGHNEKTTSWGTGIEQMTLGFLKTTLNPYLRRIEQAVRKQLIAPAERGRGLTAEFNLEGLLRADSKGRAEFYGAMTRIGALTINEVRAKENLPPVEGGDVPRLQMQNVPISEATNGLGDITGEPRNA